MIEAPASRPPSFAIRRCLASSSSAWTSTHRAPCICLDGRLEDVFVLPSFHTHLSPTASGMTFRDPLFLPGQHLFAEDGRVYHHPVVAIDALGFVSIVYEDKDRHIASPVPIRASSSAVAQLGEGNYVQMTVAPDGPVTILFSHDNAAHTEFYLYSLVSFDGINFEVHSSKPKGMPGSSCAAPCAQDQTVRSTRSGSRSGREGS
ncbi:MAG: hypothetical protein U1E76_17195 [Planctomycetota bacterium]